MTDLIQSLSIIALAVASILQSFTIRRLRSATFDAH